MNAIPRFRAVDRSADSSRLDNQSLSKDSMSLESPAAEV